VPRIRWHGQERGVSHAPHELFPLNQVHKFNVPCNMGAAGTWWSETKAKAQDCNIKVSFRAMRFNPEGPGWYTLTALGLGGAVFLEEAVRDLATRVELDWDAIGLPTEGGEGADEGEGEEGGAAPDRAGEDARPSQRRTVGLCVVNVMLGFLERWAR
jgi:hypothetical protein